MYNCFDIAKYFVKLSNKEGVRIDTMKLLKLTYIAHGWYLGFKGKPLFHNEVEAWKYGAVIPDLYHVIKIYGEGNVSAFLLSHYAKTELKDKDKDFLKIIWNNYKKFTGFELSDKTHEEGTPWADTWEESTRKLIPNKLIKRYYTEMIKNKKK